MLLSSNQHVHVCNEVSKVHHCVKDAYDNTNNTGGDHIIDEDIEMAEIREPDTPFVLLSNQLRSRSMLLMFFLNQSTVQQCYTASFETVRMASSADSYWSFICNPQGLPLDLELEIASEAITPVHENNIAISGDCGNPDDDQITFPCKYGTSCGIMDTPNSLLGRPDCLHFNIIKRVNVINSVKHLQKNRFKNLLM